MFDMPVDEGLYNLIAGSTDSRCTIYGRYDDHGIATLFRISGHFALVERVER
jgi:hypothetical protein